MNSLFTRAVNTAFSNLPSGLNEDNDYCKSFASVLTLGVSADFEFDVEEFKQASQFIESDSVLTSKGLTVRTVDFFRGYTKAIKKVMKEDNLDFPTVQTEMIAIARNCPDSMKSSLRGVIKTLSDHSGPKEREVFDRINL